MKKFYSLALVACAALTANAQIYFVGTGSVGGESLAWTPETPVTVNAASDGTYTFTINQPNGGFKMSTAKGDWSTFNSGCIFFDLSAIPNSDIPTDITAQPGNDGNIMTPWGGNYKFVIASDFSKATVTALTPKPQPGEYKPIYVRGAMNNWGNDGIDETFTATWGLTTTDGVTYVSNVVSILAGEEFKIADANWGQINYSAGGEIFINPDGDIWNYNNSVNTTLGEDFEGVITFTLENGAMNDALVIFKVNTGVDDIVVEDANAPKVYYNLQGVEVAEPSNGLYIVKQGSKVSKVVVK